MIQEENTGGYEFMSDNEDAQQEKARCIFIGGIPLNVTYRELHSYLNRFDSVVRLRLPRDKEIGVLKGFARAVMATVEGTQKIINHGEHKIGDLRFGISLWKHQKEYLHEKSQQTNKKVYVKYPTGITEQELYSYFQQYGPFESFTMKSDPFTQKSRNFCYISYVNELDAYKAIAKRIQRIGTFRVLCELSKPPNSSGKKVPTLHIPTEKKEEQVFGTSFRPPCSRFHEVSALDKQIAEETIQHQLKPTRLAASHYFESQIGFNHSDRKNLSFRMEPPRRGHPYPIPNRINKVYC